MVWVPPAHSSCPNRGCWLRFFILCFYPFYCQLLGGLRFREKSKKNARPKYEKRGESETISNWPFETGVLWISRPVSPLQIREIPGFEPPTIDHFQASFLFWGGSVHWTFERGLKEFHKYGHFLGDRLEWPIAPDLLCSRVLSSELSRTYWGNASKEAKFPGLICFTRFE